VALNSSIETYELFESFWPRAVDNLDTVHDPKLVFSKTRKEMTWKNSRLFHALDPSEIEKIKQQPGKKSWKPGTIRRAMSCFATHGIRLLSRPSMIW
jgi:hypothetical protein